MNDIFFNIWNHGDFCRIETSDCRQAVRNISDGACIFDINILLSEIWRISNECEKIGARAVFIQG